MPYFSPKEKPAVVIHRTICSKISRVCDARQDSSRGEHVMGVCLHLCETNENRLYSLSHRGRKETRTPGGRQAAPETLTANGRNAVGVRLSSIRRDLHFQETRRRDVWAHVCVHVNVFNPMCLCIISEMLAWMIAKPLPDHSHYSISDNPSSFSHCSWGNYLCVK